MKLSEVVWKSLEHAVASKSGVNRFAVDGVPDGILKSFFLKHRREASAVTSLYGMSVRAAVNPFPGNGGMSGSLLS